MLNWSLRHLHDRNKDTDWYTFAQTEYIETRLWFDTRDIDSSHMLNSLLDSLRTFLCWNLLWDPFDIEIRTCFAVSSISDLKSKGMIDIELNQCISRMEARMWDKLLSESFGWEGRAMLMDTSCQGMGWHTLFPTI